METAIPDKKEVVDNETGLTYKVDGQKTTEISIYNGSRRPEKTSTIITGLNNKRQAIVYQAWDYVKSKIKSLNLSSDKDIAELMTAVHALNNSPNKHLNGCVDSRTIGIELSHFENLIRALHVNGKQKASGVTNGGLNIDATKIPTSITFEDGRNFEVLPPNKDGKVFVTVTSTDGEKTTIDCTKEYQKCTTE